MTSIMNRSAKVGALLSSSALILCSGYGVAAQGLNTENDTIEEVIVTGSHIRRSGYETRVPIKVINRDDFKAEGASNILDIAKFLTANTGSFITQEAGNLIGTSQFNLRGLGAGSTLTLINGKRGGKSATADGNGNQFFDINQLPLNMVERIDVQTDGASTTYGSEAVAGVVNIITRKSFEGFEITGRASSASNDQWNIGAAIGAQGERGRVNVYANVHQQTRNDRSDFNWVRTRIGDLYTSPSGISGMTSSSGSPGAYIQAVLDTDGTYLGTIGTSSVDPDCEAAGGLKIGDFCRISFQDQVSIIPEESRLQVFLEAEYEVSETVNFYTELSFSHNKVLRTQGSNLFGNGDAGGRLLILGDHPFNFYVDDGASGLEYIGADNWDNSIHEGVDLTCLCRPLGAEFMGEGSEFDREYTYNYFRALTGVKVTLSENWYADVSYVYNRAERNLLTAYEYVASALNSSLAAGTYNPFGTRVTDPTLVSPKDGVSVAVLDRNDFATWHHRERFQTTSTQEVLDAVIAGDLFELSGGPIGAAFGGQYRKEVYTELNDPLWATGGASDPETQPLSIAGDNSVKAAFAELLLPVFDGLEVSLAARHEDFSSGAQTSDPKVSARWQVSPSLAVRMTYGTSFQTPSVRQQSSSTSSSFLDDPAGGIGDCSAGSVVNLLIVNVSGSDNLRPLTAKNVNGGVMYNVGNFRVAADYWHYNYTDLIRPDGEAQDVVTADCADGLANDPRVIRDPAGQLIGVNLSFINTGKLVTDGLDFNFGYDFDETDFGVFQINGSLSYVKSFNVELIEGAKFDGAGSRNFTNPFSSVPRWRGNLRLAWQKQSHSANAVMRYISSYDNDQVGDGTHVEKWASLDLRYAYNMGEIFNADNTNVSIGMNNAFDKKPPTLGVGVRPGYDANVHDVRGRVMYAEFTIGF